MSTRRAIGWLSAILAAVGSGAFWAVALSVAYGLVAGDRAPWLPQPPAWQGMVKVVAVVLVAASLHALLAAGWRRIDRRLTR